MPKAKHICFDRLLPSDLNRPQRQMTLANGRVRAISLIGKQWINGSTLRIRFMGGTAEQQQLVRDIAPAWTDHANLRFEFTDDPRAEVRVSFDPDDGAWSYVGTDNSQIPLHAATMNLGWQDQAVILHEFGHMIGLSHEHQNPDGGIEWNEEEVIRDLSGPPNWWDEATIRRNVLDRYRADQIHGTEFDPDSVMLYAFPASWTRNMAGTRENEAISAMDRAFVASEVMYPGRAAGEVQELEIYRGSAQEIAHAGEEDVFSFRVTEPGEHIVETTGATDVVIVLFGPDNRNLRIAEDDDGGVGRNSRIVAELSNGEYFVAVRHYDPDSRGAYRIMVRAA